GLCAVPVGQAATHVVAAGQTLTLKADLVLAGDDVLEVRGTAAKRCTILGNDHRIRTAPGWKGHVRVTHCDLRGLGTAKLPSVDLSAAGAGEKIIFEHCVWDDCGPVHLRSAEKAA